MGQTTYRTLLFLSFFLPLFLLGRQLTDERFSAQIRPDTQSYVLSSPYRTFLYPTFLNATLNEEAQRTGVLQANSHAFSKVANTQKALFLISILALLAVCHRFIPFSHLVFAFLGLVFFRGSTSGYAAQVGWIQPEGLIVSWIALLVALSIELIHTKKRALSIFFSVFLFLGILLSPRLVCFFPFALVPFLTFKSLKHKLAPVLVYFALIGFQLSFTYSKASVFALSPINGIYTIGNVMRLIDVSALEEFSSPKERTFLTRVLSAPNRKQEMKDNDWMTWTFGTKIYRETFPEKFSGLVKGKDVIHMNRFYSQFFSTLFFRNSAFRDSWSTSAVSYVNEYLRQNRFLNLFLLLLALTSLFFFRKTNQLVLGFPVIALAAHWVNILCTIPFSGLVSRYTFSTEVLILFSAFAMILFSWDRVASLILKQLSGSFHQTESPAST